jgi:hypothetical protein
MRSCDPTPRLDKRSIWAAILVVILLIFGLWFVHRHMIGTGEHPKVTVEPK